MLSRVDPEPSKADPVSSGTDPALARTVLVADDDGEMRLLIRAALEQDGWTVEEASDGANACTSVQRLQPDIVLLDVGMPELDGFEVCARLRILPGSENIPVLMITGMDDQESISRAYEAGATDFLSKPFNFTVLRQRLQYMYRARQASCELQSERDFVSALVDTSAALVLVLDSAGRITRFNGSCERASGFSMAEVNGKRLSDLLCNSDGRDDERHMFEQLISSRRTQHREGCWVTKDGSKREIAWSNSVLLSRDGEVEHLVYTGLDITERNQAEEKVRFLASYDPLTGLPNRRLVTERLEEAVSATDVDGFQLAVLFLDLDRFKNVNATWGHTAGNQVLAGVAERLSRSLRLGDVLARHCPGLRAELGRLGGDEFTVLLSGVSSASEVAGIAARLQSALRRPFKIAGKELTITAAVGAALHPADGSDSESLLRNAESAMHAAQTDMPGSLRFYSAAMRTSVSDRLSLEAELRLAVDRGEFELHYQPKVFAQTERIASAEALLRWQHPTRGLVLPATFIGMAEETGLIVPLGEWVLREACN